MFGSIGLLVILPWLDSHPVRSARFRPYYRVSVLLFTLSVFVLGYAGSQPADKVYFSTCIGEVQACEAQAHGGGHGGGSDHAEGSHGADPIVLKFDNTMLAQAFTGFYFFYFLLLLPLLSRFEPVKQLPASIHQAVLDKKQKAGV